MKQKLLGVGFNVRTIGRGMGLGGILPNTIRWAEQPMFPQKDARRSAPTEVVRGRSRLSTPQRCRGAIDPSTW